MAVSAQLPAALRIGGHYTSLVANEIVWDLQVVDVDTTAFATVPYMTCAAGLKKVMLGPKAYQDFASGAADELMRAYIGTTQACSLTPEGDTAGNAAVLAQGLVKTYTPMNAKVGDVGDLGLALGGTGVVAEGKLSIDGATSRVATTTGTAVQLGAVAAGKSVYAACHLTTFSGTITSVTFSLQSDNASNFPSSATVATGSALTAVGSSWLSGAGPITDDWFRVVATVVGASPTFVVAAAIGIA